MRIIITTTLAALMLAGCSQDAATEDAPAYDTRQYSAAINDIARPATDRATDEARKPGELLAFAQIDRGDFVGDYIMGGGYLTRLLAMAVGPNGKVYAFQPDEFIAMRPEYADEQDAAVAPYADDRGNPLNVFALRGPIAAPGFPQKLDTIVTAMNLHDLFLEQIPEGSAQTAIAALYDALKPGGTLVVVDHHATDGAGVEAANLLHRMDGGLARKALTEAGFVIEEESDLYANPDDPRDTVVFDDSIRGRTDQFAWRLRKPE